MKKLFSTVLNRKTVLIMVMSLINCIQMLAGPSDHGRWYSLDDSPSASHSPTFYVLCFILAAICAIFLIIATLNDKNQNSSDKGCIVTFFIGLLILGFFALMSLLN